ncbi:MAG: trehalose-6-phosphate synthase [Deltaproteobacteria bacterium]|nr:trehalose-6-phosphate synthase [Deltaproteobacteria bacterium]
MSRALRFVVALVAGLALLTWAASFLVRGATTRWFDRDLNLRAQLAVRGARQALITHWHKDPSTDLVDLLTEMTRDERIMAAAACDLDGRSLGSTDDFPPQFLCRSPSQVAGRSGAAPAPPWRLVAALRGGQVHASALPVLDGETTLGYIVLVQDRSFIGRREAQVRWFLAAAFGILAVGAAVITMIAARLAWRGWSAELRRLLRGGPQRPEFQPLLRDVRDLIERIATEKDADNQDGAWTAQRLRQTLDRHFHGEKVVILANREPYMHERAADGGVKIVHPASGLVTALEPVMRACSGVWVAHGSASADRETADAAGRVRVPPGEESYVLRRVWLTAEAEQGYYYGFSNEGLWPLCHVAHTRPLFRGDDWKHYQAVNQRFSDAVCEEVDSEDPVILVQDYHFALAPAMIRRRLPRATIITFWHIPWPNAERIGICPWRTELLEGLLGSSIIGFHTQFHCNNFLETVDRFMEARIDREQNAIVHLQRATLVKPYPISVEWPSRWSKQTPPPAECRAQIFDELGLGPDAILGVGVDRLDYTKGIEERLLAVERLLERVPSLCGRFTFVQLAAPSRTIIERYRQLNETVEAVAARINQRFARPGYQPIVIKRSHHEPPTVFRYYRAADLCYVSSLHDGMNLVAKEFIAARDDERGVLVLSSFTGAARELTEALIVNPYDIDEASAALATAIEMSAEEQGERMRSMRAFVAEFNVDRWAGRMLVDAARVRRRFRLRGRLDAQRGDIATVP